MRLQPATTAAALGIQMNSRLPSAQAGPTGSFETRIKGPFSVTSSRQVYRNPWIQVTEETVVRPDGSNGLFGTIDIHDGVAILPIYPDGGILLAREYRYAQDAEMIEVFGGQIEPGESPEQAARRELAEEAGVDAVRFRALGVVNPFSSLVRTRVHLMVATHLHDLAVRPTADDQVEAIQGSLADAVDQVLRGQITHAVSSLLILRAAHLFPQHLGKTQVGSISNAAPPRAAG